MGLEYKIETSDAARTGWQDLLQRRLDFLFEKDGAYHLGPSNEQILISVKEEGDHIYLCQHAATVETDALLGLLIRRLLSHNDRVVISEP